MNTCLIMGQLSIEPPCGMLAGQAINPSPSPEPGLLFYLSGEKEFTADFAAGGQTKPNYLSGLKMIKDGFIGKGFEADDYQLMSYWAPGNIYGQRGTISFFWRSAYPVGPTAFPIFRVAFADHTSWDMAWLRIDYNGSGIDAFVTDVGLSRTRISYYMDEFPGPKEWMHIAFSWDEAEGIRLYINGELVGKQTVTGKVYDTGLDQFGPHSRVISPNAVQSWGPFIRGGHLDEVRIYDCMLSDQNIVQLSKGEVPQNIPSLQRNLSERKWRNAWWDRHGWNLPNDPPKELLAENTVIKKVGIHEAYDVKRWIWKANDGIRETTWPGVYNMSRLPGRYDYFVYPDWDCYSVSGQSIEFSIPDEPWNHVEVWGKAWGQLTWEKEHQYDFTFGVRNKDQVKSYHDLEHTARGGKLRYDNALIEEPIGELGVYHVHEGQAPAGIYRESFTLDYFPDESESSSMANVLAFINGRYPKDERMKMIALGEDDETVKQPATKASEETMPFIHVLLPYTPMEDYGLDGIEIELPALSVEPTHNGLYPLNIRIKDPLWPMRDMADFSFSVKPGKSQTLFIDTRDRILPGEKVLYMTLAGAGYGLVPEALKGAKVRLVYNDREEAKKEHVLDRFTQIRDLYGFSVEDRPYSTRLNLYNRFMVDHADLTRIDPDHWLGKAYLYAKTKDKADRPDYNIAEPPPGIPSWAFFQVQYLRHFEQIINYYIDERQICNGELGGGLSDDDDFSYFFIGPKLMGLHPQKIQMSLKRLMEAYYDQEREPYNAPLKQKSLPLFTNGLPTIMTDQGHAFEEGSALVGQLMVTEFGNPVYFNRAMETAKKFLEQISRIAPDGHRHFPSRLYSGTKMAMEDPWQWSHHSSSFLNLQNIYLLVNYNGHPALKEMIVEFADGLLDHRSGDGRILTEIHFSSGKARRKTNMDFIWPLFYAAYEYTGNEKYLEFIEDKIVSERSFNENKLVDYYTEQIKEMGVRSFIDTQGSIWIDRISGNDIQLQTHRLGGPSLIRGKNLFPLHHVSWKIKSDDGFESLAMFSTKADDENIEMIVYNLENKTVNASLNFWNIKPGKWNVVQGLDIDNDQEIDELISNNIFELQQGDELNFHFASHQNTILQLSLTEASSTTYWERPDLAICREYLKIHDNKVVIRIYNLGAVSSEETIIELRDAEGKIVNTVPVPVLEAPNDLIPKWKDVLIKVPEGTDLSKGSIWIDPDKKMDQITRINTFVRW